MQNLGNRREIGSTRGSLVSPPTALDFDFRLLAAFLFNFTVVTILGVLIDYLLFVDKGKTPKIMRNVTAIGACNIVLLFAIFDQAIWINVMMVALFGLLSSYFFIRRFRVMSL